MGRWPRLYQCTYQLLFDHLSSEIDGIKFLDRNALWLDVGLKLFFFASGWQVLLPHTTPYHPFLATFLTATRPTHSHSWRKAVMDALVLAQEGSNRLAREALMLGPDRYEPRHAFLWGFYDILGSTFGGPYFCKAHVLSCLGRPATYAHMARSWQLRRTSISTSRPWARTTSSPVWRGAAACLTKIRR